MDRITQKNLDGVVELLNRLTDSPLEAWIEGEDGKYLPQGNNFHINSCNGGVSLVRMCATGPGENNILGRGTKRDLYERIHAYIDGVMLGRANQSPITQP